MQIFGVGYKTSIIIYLFLHIICVIATEKLMPTNLPSQLEQVNKVGGPMYTFIKTDKEANIKWGVYHYVPRENKIKVN